jgi:hypothetical protein
MRLGGQCRAQQQGLQAAEQQQQQQQGTEGEDQLWLG